MPALRGILAEQTARFGCAGDHVHQDRLPLGFEAEHVKTGVIGHAGWESLAGTLLPPRFLMARVNRGEPKHSHQAIRQQHPAGKPQLMVVNTPPCGRVWPANIKHCP